MGSFTGLEKFGGVSGIIFAGGDAGDAVAGVGSPAEQAELADAE